MRLRRFRSKSTSRPHSLQAGYFRRPRGSKIWIIALIAPLLLGMGLWIGSSGDFKTIIPRLEDRLPAIEVDPHLKDGITETGRTYSVAFSDWKLGSTGEGYRAHEYGKALGEKVKPLIGTMRVSGDASRVAFGSKPTNAWVILAQAFGAEIGIQYQLFGKANEKITEGTLDRPSMGEAAAVEVRIYHDRWEDVAKVLLKLPDAEGRRMALIKGLEGTLLIGFKGMFGDGLYVHRLGRDCRGTRDSQVGPAVGLRMQDHRLVDEEGRTWSIKRFCTDCFGQQ